MSANGLPARGDLSESGRLARLLKPAEAARVLSIGKRKLWELTNCRAIPYLKIGRVLRYDVRDLERWIETRKVKVRDADTRQHG